MTSRTTGGLIKRSMVFEEGQLRAAEQLAAERHQSTSAVVRSLMELGLKVERRRKEISGPSEGLVEGLVVDVVSRDA